MTAVNEPREGLAWLEQVTVVVVTFESAHCLVALAPLLEACPQVIIVDNASGDGTPGLVRQLLPHARLIACPRNLGFGAANNRALDQLTTPLAFLLNPDAIIAPEDLARLAQASEHFPDAAVLAPQLRSARGTPDLSYRWPSTRWKSQGPPAQGPLCVGFVSGAAMLLVMRNLGRASRFDERFFLYYEDDDLCLRLFEQGSALVLIPAISATHAGRASVGTRRRLRGEYLRGYHHAQSKLWFAQKHAPPRAKPRAEPFSKPYSEPHSEPHSESHSEPYSEPQSNLYYEPHSRLSAASLLRWRTLALALLAWPLRLLVFSPRLIARLTGRIAGLLSWRPHE